MKRKYLFWFCTILVLMLLTLWAFRPAPIPVETARVQKGDLQVSVVEDGETRVHDRYVVTAPVSSKVSRIELHEGEEVKEGQVVALLSPLPLDSRRQEELTAHMHSVEALQQEARERMNRAAADLDLARKERKRTEELRASNVASVQSLEQAITVETTASREYEAARFRSQAITHDLEEAKAALLTSASNPEKIRSIQVHVPVSGRVLSIPEKSERIVSAGTPLIILGNPEKMEVVIDVLTEDAVKIHERAPVLLENWGGDKPLQARVRSVEASAFTKVSALGVEEQRVNVILDFVDDPGQLKDGYRVEARIQLWQGSNVLKVPISSLFRYEGNWAVFVIEGNRARLRKVEIGHRNESEAVVMNSLKEGETVIIHPSNRIKDGIRISRV